MNNSEYWAERFAQIEDAQHRKAGLIAANIYDAYERAKRELNKKITLWYARFAENNDITLAEAKRWLASKDLEEFRWDVWDYIQHGEENAIDQRWMKELENASARVHVSKYEALKIQMRQSLEELATKYEGTMQEGMSDVYQSSFYHTAFEIQKGFEVGFDIAGVDQHLMEKVLSKPWAADGLNFSDRIWKNKQLLVDTLDKELTQGLILGKDPQKVINAVSDKMDVSKSQAGRLVMTESAYFGSEARKDCFKELDVEQYIIVATLDNRTSETCREMDGKVFNMSDYKVGLTAPPFHINCRTTTAPYFEDMQGIGERAARDEVTGKTYTVPRDMKYGEWKKRFVKEVDPNSIDYLSNDSGYKLGEKGIIYTTTSSNGKIKMDVQQVTNGKFNMVTDTRSGRNRSIRLTEEMLTEVQKRLPEGFEVPDVAVVDFEKWGIDVDAIAGYDHSNKTLFVNRQYDTREKMLEFLNRHPGRFASTSKYAPYIHELGHKAYYDAIESLATKHSLSYNEAKYIVDTEIMNVIKENGCEYDMASRVSQYAHSGYCSGKFTEVYAECFTVRDKNELARQIIEAAQM